MTETEKASEDVAHYLAAKGEAAIAQMQAAVERAWEILADAKTPLTTPDWIPEPYPWQEPEDLPSGTRSTIWRTCVEDFATGEGHTVTVFAALARSENAFRRYLATQVSHYQANCAQVRQGAAGDIPGVVRMVSPDMQAMMERLEQADDKPAVFSFVARYHTNYS